MVQYRKHRINYGETIQAISQKYYQDTSYWVDIVEYNDLKYPYIVNSIEEKNKNINHLVTAGDTLIIPQEINVTSINPVDISKREQDVLVNYYLGSDIDVMSASQDYRKRGTSDEILRMTDYKGDLSVSEGLDNIKQQLQMRLLTPKGSLILHPDYGSDLHKLFKENIPEVGLLIENEVIKTILTDTRTKSVETIDWRIEGNTYTGMFNVELTSIEQSIKFMLTRIEDDMEANFEEV